MTCSLKPAVYFPDLEQSVSLGGNKGLVFFSEFSKPKWENVVEQVRRKVFDGNINAVEGFSTDHGLFYKDTFISGYNKVRRQQSGRSSLRKAHVK